MLNIQNPASTCGLNDAGIVRMYSINLSSIFDVQIQDVSPGAMFLRAGVRTIAVVSRKGLGFLEALCSFYNWPIFGDTDLSVQHQINCT